MLFRHIFCLGFPILGIAFRVMAVYFMNVVDKKKFSYTKLESTTVRFWNHCNSVMNV